MRTWCLSLFTLRLPPGLFLLKPGTPPPPHPASPISPPTSEKDKSRQKKEQSLRSPSVQAEEVGCLPPRDRILPLGSARGPPGLPFSLQETQSSPQLVPLPSAGEPTWVSHDKCPESPRHLPPLVHRQRPGLQGARCPALSHLCPRSPASAPPRLHSCQGHRGFRPLLG